jgi:hypothetical protein
MGKDHLDPTKDAEFQQVVQTFLRTPPQPHASAREAFEPSPKRCLLRPAGLRPQPDYL